MRALLAVLLLLATLPLEARAAESAPVTSPRLTATLVSDTDAVAPGQPFRLGLRLRMAPGWHTYWQNPGDAGSPPELTLALPGGSTAAPIDWPVPQRLAEGPVMTFAYTGEVLLPLVVTPGQGAQHIEASATWLVCEKICVPEEGRFTLDLPQGTPSPSAETKLFAATAPRLPVPSPFPATIAPDGTLSLQGEGLSRATVADAWFFPATWRLIDQVAPQPATIRDGLVQIALKPGDQFAAAKPLQGLVVLRDPAGAESVLRIDAAPGAGPARADGPFLPRILLLALAGGLLLNLMPCVFPILAMKALGLARMSGQARAEARSHAAFYTLGVVLAFAGLGAILLAARTAGEVAGWGFQFQSPVFVAAMAGVLLLVGLNLSGVFEVGAGLAGAGQGLAARGGRTGSFFIGLLAVLVATPCTAPFMGAAIAFALAAPAAVTLAVFVAMGLGMALPYLLLGLFPGWARALPRPGRWMDVLRGVLAFPMYGAVAWLLWVLSLQAGPDGVLAAVSALVLLAFAAWSLGQAQRAGRRMRIAGQVLALVTLVGAGALVFGIAPSPASAASADSAERFSPARLAALRAEGRPVFVNMTAAWCVTCLVNEKIALSPGAVQTAFATHRVAYLKGDWTRGDPEITEFLRANARDGVPLYVFYPPGSGAPRVLPQILTEAVILSQLGG